ncbi:MAG TPA: AraC family transcriptional regulator [Rhizomicrobium sp.]|jgi:AraC-like DNA-binding protein|nr:AraC family transcriptional regulator [Rhizomicrobium sp.]
MPAIPLPFVVSLFLAVLLARLILEGERQLRPAIWFFAACILASTVTALRWSFDLEVARLIQPITGSLLPVIAWLCFSHLKQPPSRLWFVLLGAAALFGVVLIAIPWPGDLMLAALYLGVGAALIHMAKGSPDDFGAARLADVRKAQGSVLLAGITLIGSGLCDILIGMDFRLYSGSHVIGIIAVADSLFLPLIAYAVVAAGDSIALDEPGPRDEEAPHSDPVPRARDEVIFAAFDAVMRERKLYCDPDLTLNRLARRLGRPAREISGAVNRLKGRNVSQLVNEYRITEAQILLSGTEMSVTEVMLASGFRTKSNFNREFLRITGANPSAWRRAPQNGATDGVIAT